MTQSEMPPDKVAVSTEVPAPDANRSLSTLLKDHTTLIVGVLAAASTVLAAVAGIVGTLYVQQRQAATEYNETAVEQLRTSCGNFGPMASDFERKRIRIAILTSQPLSSEYQSALTDLERSNASVQDAANSLGFVRGSGSLYYAMKAYGLRTFVVYMRYKLLRSFAPQANEEQQRLWEDNKKQLDAAEKELDQARTTLEDVCLRGLDHGP